MKLSKAEQQAIIAYTAENGGYRRLMQVLSVSEPTAIRIGKGRSKIIQSHIWEQLQPLIAPYMTQQQPCGNPSDTPLDTPARAMIDRKLNGMTEGQLEQVLAFILGMPK